MNGGGWGSVDGYLCVLARFEPSFKAVLRVGFEGCSVGSLVKKHFSLAWSRGIVRVEHVPGL